MMVSPKRSMATPPPGTSLPCHPPSLIAGEGSRRWEDKASLKTGEERERSGLGMASSHLPAHLSLDHNDGQFFRAMEWLMFFLGHHCRQWFFNGFDKVGPSPLNVFLGVQPLEPMVFRWFSKFWGQWSTMVLQYISMQNVGWGKFGLYLQCAAINIKDDWQ